MRRISGFLHQVEKYLLKYLYYFALLSWNSRYQWSIYPGFGMSTNFFSENPSRMNRFSAAQEIVRCFDYKAGLVPHCDVWKNFHDGHTKVFAKLTRTGAMEIIYVLDKKNNDKYKRRHREKTCAENQAMYFKELCFLNLNRNSRCRNMEKGQCAAKAKWGEQMIQLNVSRGFMRSATISIWKNAINIGTLLWNGRYDMYERICFTNYSRICK